MDQWIYSKILGERMMIGELLWLLFKWSVTFLKKNVGLSYYWVSRTGNMDCLNCLSALSALLTGWITRVIGIAKWRGISMNL
jgi:hypothetical protein